MNDSYATEPFCQTARESARDSPPPGLTPYWDINRAEASAIFSFSSPRPRTDFQRLSSYQIPSSAISIPSNFIFFKSLCGGERVHIIKANFKEVGHNSGSWPCKALNVIIISLFLRVVSIGSQCKILNISFDLTS